jgi:hypothetical protein
MGSGPQDPQNKMGSGPQDPQNKMGWGPQDPQYKMGSGPQDPQDKMGIGPQDPQDKMGSGPQDPQNKMGSGPQDPQNKMGSGPQDPQNKMGRSENHESGNDVPKHHQATSFRFDYLRRAIKQRKIRREICITRFFRKPYRKGPLERPCIIRKDNIKIKFKCIASERAKTVRALDRAATVTALRWHWYH